MDPEVKKTRITAVVQEQKELVPGIFDLRLLAPRAAADAKAGQFVNLYCADSSRLLPRPVSLAGIDREKGILRLVYRVSGAGTEEFSGLAKGDKLELIGPLGNGFSIEESCGRHVLLAGGGIGIPPLLETAKELKAAGGCAEITAILGYRDSRTFLAEEFAAFGTVLIATEDGSTGRKGTVLDILEQYAFPEPETAYMLLACGPAPMLRALQTFAAEKKICCRLSLEERMACGVGACLACVCRTKETDTHSKVKNRRVCKEGPVFAAEDIVF